MSATESDELLVLYSRLAFYPIHWRALRRIVARYRAHAVVLAAPEPELSSVHRAHGTAGGSDERIEVRRAPSGRLARLRWLRSQLRQLRPDALWLQEEPTDPFVLEALALHLRDARVRIACAVCENVFDPLPGPVGRLRTRLWSRLDVLLAVASPAVHGIRRAGMPSDVRVAQLVAGALEPPRQVVARDLGLRRADGDFVIGYAGNFTEQKGWRVLFDAVEQLPPRFRLAVAGDGPERAAVEARLANASLAERSTYVGLLPKDELWGFYASVDAIAMPSLTQPRLVEQFGGVLADAMAMGVPLVGSSSGAIPEVMGPAGLVVAEGDAGLLADALARLADDEPLRTRLAAAGPPRFTREFAIDAYADKIAAALRLRPRAGNGLPSPG